MSNTDRRVVAVNDDRANGNTPAELTRLIATMTKHGFREIDGYAKRPDLRKGARVHNRSEQYPEAYDHGTATVVGVYRHGSDEAPSLWERTYGRPNVEVLVRRDQEKFGGLFAYWADYSTYSASEQPASCPDGHPFNTFSHDGYDCNDGTGIS